MIFNESELRGASTQVVREHWESFLADAEASGRRHDSILTQARRSRAYWIPDLPTLYIS